MYTSPSKYMYIDSILSFTLYYIILNFNDPLKRGLWKTLLEKEKMLVTSIFSFSLNVFYSVKERDGHFSNADLSSTNAFNFVISKILLFGKG